MILPMNRHFQPYQSHVVPFTQLGKGNMDIFGGSSPYSQGSNGLGGMFRGLVRTATPFLKSAAKKVGKRLLKTGVDTGMQIFGDVLNGQSLKKAATARTKVAGKEFLISTFNVLFNDNKRETVAVEDINANEKPFLPVQLKTSD